MPEENQKLWTKLVKRQSRTTWAVLGVALVALLLAVWWVPILAKVPEISLSSGDDGENGENGEELAHDGHAIRILRRHASAEIHGHFAIEIWCSDSFQVKAVYADVDDPDYHLRVGYFKVFIQRAFTGAGVETWDIRHEGFTASDSHRGVELLSAMEVELTPVGVPRGFTFVIGGVVRDSLDSGDDTLTVIAVLESAGRCNVVIDP